MDASSSFSTWETIKLVLSAGVVSAAFTAGVNWLRDSRKEKVSVAREATHLAMLLAFQFEGYAVNAASKAVDHNTAMKNEGHAGAFLSKVPEPLPVPRSEAYRLLDKSLLSDVLDFPQQVQLAQEAAAFWWDTVGDGDAMNVALEENTIKMGTRAIEIARKFRVAYGLGARPLRFGQWDIDEYFTKEVARLEELEKRRRVDEVSLAEADPMS